MIIRIAFNKVKQIADRRNTVDCSIYHSIEIQMSSVYQPLLEKKKERWIYRLLGTTEEEMDAATERSRKALEAQDTFWERVSLSCYDRSES